MNLNFRKTALLAGICSVFSLGYAPQLFAVSSTDTVEAVQQTKKITGVVSDAMGPIIGANVLEKGTTNGVITDIDGNFALNVKPGATIVVSFIGYVSQEIKITNQTTVNNAEGRLRDVGRSGGCGVRYDEEKRPFRCFRFHE